MGATKIKTAAAQEAKESAYRITVEMRFHGLEKEDTVINSNRIIYLMFNYEYFTKTMPMCMAYLQVPIKLYQLIINKQNTGKVYMKITGIDPSAKNGISKKIMTHEFTYITVNQNQPYGINTDKIDDDDKYRGIYLGFVDDEMTNYLRTPFNGIYQNTTMSKLLSLGLAGGKRKCYIEPFKYDYEYDQILVPACSNRKKFLEFLYDYDQFYDDYFNFFIDYDATYMLSQSGLGGNGVLDHGKSMTIDIRPIDDENAFKSGYTKKKGNIYLYINQLDVSVNANTSAPQIANKVISYGERRDPTEYKITDGERLVFVRSGSSDNPNNHVSNEIKTSDTIIELAKNDIDPNIFNPSRSITVKMYDDYLEFSGIYRLYYKRVIYKQDEGEFIVATNVGLVPTGETIPAHIKSERQKQKEEKKKKKNFALSRSANTTSSADIGSTITFRGNTDTSTEQDSDFTSLGYITDEDDSGITPNDNNELLR